MKRILAVTAMTVALTLSPSPVEAHAIRCSPYVGNESCFRQAASHAWWHRCIQNAVMHTPTHRVTPRAVKRCIEQAKHMAAR